LYGDGGGSLFVDTLDATKITWTGQFTLQVSGFAYNNGLLYTAVKTVVDPVSKIVIEQLPPNDFLSDAGVAVSADDNRIYYITWDAQHNKRILDFDLNSYVEAPLFDTGVLPGGADHFIACSNHTVAFNLFGSGVTKNIVLVRGLK